MPTVIKMSCTTAAMADAAIFHSKRKLMYRLMATKKNTSARIALLVIDLPHDGPTVFSVSVSAGTLPTLARRLLTSSHFVAWLFSVHLMSAWTRTTRLLPVPTTWIFDSAI